jgi:hypothetical protein
MPDLVSNSKSYQDLLARLKSQIRTAQVRAAVAVNQELVLLYWGIGKEILVRQRERSVGEPGSSSVWPKISVQSFRTCKGSRPVISVI